MIPAWPRNTQLKCNRLERSRDSAISVIGRVDARDLAFSSFFGSVEMTRMQLDVIEHEPRKTAESGLEVMQ